MLAKTLDEAQIIEEYAAANTNDRRPQPCKVRITPVGAMNPCAQPVLYAGMAFLDLFDGTGDDLRLAERRRRT